VHLPGRPTLLPEDLRAGAAGRNGCPLNAWRFQKQLNMNNESD
jgi:hypothetical protein